MLCAFHFGKHEVGYGVMRCAELSTLDIEISLQYDRGTNDYEHEILKRNELN